LGVLTSNLGAPILDITIYKRLKWRSGIVRSNVHRIKEKSNKIIYCLRAISMEMESLRMPKNNIFMFISILANKWSRLQPRIWIETCVSCEYGLIQPSIGKETNGKCLHVVDYQSQTNDSPHRDILIIFDALSAAVRNKIKRLCSKSPISVFMNCHWLTTMLGIL